MEIAKILVGTTSGTARNRLRIPARAAGLTVSVIFTDPAWNNLTKTVVFRGTGSRIAEFDGKTAVIPWEVLSEPGTRVYFGIYGTDSENDMILPLIEVDIGVTENSANPQADPGTDPTLPVWAQLQEDIEELKDSVPGGPGSPGRPGEDGEDGGYYTPSVSQPDPETVQFDFAPSKSDMPAVAPTKITLPAQNSGGNVSWDDITDKPFDAEVVVCYDNPAMQLDDFCEYTETLEKDFLIPGETYEVVCKGVTYVLECFAFDSVTSRLEGSDLVISTERFPDNSIEMLVGTLGIADEYEVISFKVSHRKSIKTLDSKYLPMEEIVEAVAEALPDSGGNADYVLPVGGDELGGVKNGGNVVINADGTMTAPTSGGGSSGGGMTSTEKNALLTILDAVIVEANKQPVVAEALALLRQLWSGGEVFVSQSGTTLVFDNVTAVTSITQHGTVLALA